MPHNLAVITVVYQNYEVLKDLFQSLKNQTNQSFHLFIVDVSKNKQKIVNQDLNLTIIDSANLGYAHGVNIGLKQAINSKYNKFCIINSDVILKNDFVEKILQSLENNPFSIISGKIYYAPGFEYHKKYQQQDLGKVIWYGGGHVDWQNAFTKHIGVDQVDNHQLDKFQQTEFISGCLMCFDKQVIDKIGFWDENYFLYFEDADFCERAKRKGIKLYYDPSIVIWHKNAQSTEGSGSIIHQKYQKINQLKFGLKYAPLKTKIHLIKNYVLSFFQ